MRRREFLASTALAAAGTSLVFAFGKSTLSFFTPPPSGAALPPVSPQLNARFRELVNWLHETGWGAYLERSLGIELADGGDGKQRALVGELDPIRLVALQQTGGSGFEDFGGVQLIKPGFPAFSLLYHALASPRVRPAGVTAYPSLEQIDTLENYIYALSDWSQLKAHYGMTSDAGLVLAVFAYEYRPAHKTPHQEHADCVYSRTGVARIGDQPMNYDAENRCFVNKPTAEARIKSVAVTPARYGLFLARRVKNTEIDLIRTGIFKTDAHNDSRDALKVFLQPIRKVFNNDLLINETPLIFEEAHQSEKLYKLSLSPGFKILNNAKPLIRRSKELILQDIAATSAGSSFLVVSRHEPLIRHAKAGTQKLYFQVPKGRDDNRYFTAYSTQEVEDIELMEGARRSSNNYGRPRNQAMFVNITHEQYKDAVGYRLIRRDSTRYFENYLHKGAYYAPLFEDSICDGKVQVQAAQLDLSKFAGLKKEVLPAFSIVTAPDFFPQVDPLDLVAFDVAPGNSSESHFYEGGVASLATARIRPNPKAVGVADDSARLTYTAVLSGKYNAGAGRKVHGRTNFKDPALQRDYYTSSFLPDVSSSVFAPGWDVTYSSDKRYGPEIYIGTEGLGSPFIEDMKFCAALNGMWPATSPDASRTYQGAHETEYRNPTAIPLLDSELGYHKNAPCTDPKLLNTFGWDGEQGPYLERVKGEWTVNFTDLGRADAVQNTLENRLDMSVLRLLTSAELIRRMTCLKLCIASLPKKNFATKENDGKMVAYTYLWLVSAEKVSWGKEDAPGHGIPAMLKGNSKDWITARGNAKVNGDGYLFVFVVSEGDDELKRDWADLKRRRLKSKNIYVCQVTPTSIAWQEVSGETSDWKIV